MRFRCLLKKLRYHPTKSSKIIYACATLHNFLINHGFNVHHNLNENELQAIMHNENQIQVNQAIPNANRLGNVLRNELKNLLLLQRV